MVLAGEKKLRFDEVGGYLFLIGICKGENYHECIIFWCLASDGLFLFLFRKLLINCQHYGRTCLEVYIFLSWLTMSIFVLLIFHFRSTAFVPLLLLYLLFCDWLAVGRSVDGKYVAVGRKNNLSVFSSKFKEEVQISLPTDTWTDERDTVKGIWLPTAPCSFWL